MNPRLLLSIPSVLVLDHAAELASLSLGIAAAVAAHHQGANAWIGIPLTLGVQIAVMLALTTFPRRPRPLSLAAVRLADRVMRWALADTTDPSQAPSEGEVR